MALVFVLILMCLGIALTQVASAPKSVTLRWLRLGDLIALSVIVMSLVWSSRVHQSDESAATPPYAVEFALLAGFIVHVCVVQLGMRQAQRAVGIGTVVITLLLLARTLAVQADMQHWFGVAEPMSFTQCLTRVAALALSGWLIGGFLMAMLLGHAYLTAGGEMTQAPFMRQHRILLAATAVRLVMACLGGLFPWWSVASGNFEDPAVTWQTVLILSRFLVGLLVPFGLTIMSHQCARIRSNQSATGILYVSGILILIGELTALSLTTETGFVF